MTHKPTTHQPDRVFMIGWEYPPHNSGGLGVACEGLTRALSEINTQIYFTLPYFHPDPVSHMQLIGCLHPSWQSDQKQPKPPFQAYDTVEFDAGTQQFFGRSLDRHRLRALPQSELENQVDKYADLVTKTGQATQDQYDVIHAHDWMSFPSAWRLSQKTGKPYVAHVHSTEYDRIPHGYGSHYVMNTEYRGMLGAHRVVAVSYYTKRLLVDKYKIDADKIDVVHNGINPLAQAPDPGSHHFAHKRPVVVFMGRLTMQKGAEYFIDLAHRVTNRLPSTLFVVAGSGDMYHELLLRTASQGLSASVLFSGFVRSFQRDKLLDRADVFVMPSLSEPFGLVALEAAQRHTPVIVSKNAGVSEVLPSSVQLDFWDVEGMSHKIVELLNNQAQAHQVSQNQLKDLDNVTWQNSALQISQVYRKAFLGSGGSTG